MTSLSNRIFWVYLNIDIVPVAWTAYRGVLLTVGNIGTKEFRPLSYWPLGLLRNHHRTRFQKELRLEEIRREFYPHQVSRLHGLYVWGDYDSAVRGQQRWGTAAGTHFHSDYLVELSFTYSGLSRVDTTWIDKFLLPDTIPFDESDVGWMHSYWKGDPYPDSAPLWEYIVEGRGMIQGIAIREKAYEIVRQQAPMSLGQLELGRIALELGIELYHIAPYVWPSGGTKLMVAYLLDARYGINEIMEMLGGHLAQADSSSIRWDAINLLKGTTSTPDLQHLSFEINPSEFMDDIARVLRAIVSVYVEPDGMG